MPLTKEQIQKEIEEMDSYVPVSKIEKTLGMPPSTLQKVLSGKRSLPKKWVRVLESYFVRKPDEPKKEPPKNNPEPQKAETHTKPFMSDKIKKKLGIK